MLAPDFETNVNIAYISEVKYNHLLCQLNFRIEPIFLWKYHSNHKNTVHKRIEKSGVFRIYDNNTAGR